MNMIRAVDTIALAMAVTTPAFAQNPDAVRTQCLQSAAANRDRNVAQCRPNPRDPRVLQNCLARHNETYGNVVARCEQNYRQSLQRRR